MNIQLFNLNDVNKQNKRSSKVRQSRKRKQDDKYQGFK